MTLSGYFTSKSVFDQQGCRALTFALARLSCCAIGWEFDVWLAKNKNKSNLFTALQHSLLR